MQTSLQTPSPAAAQAFQSASSGSPGMALDAGQRQIVLWSDDPAAAAGWSRALAAEGLNLFGTAHDVPSTSDAVGMASPTADAIVLHITRGLSDQLARLRETRRLSPWTPLIVACRPLRELDQVLALEMGADDVIDAAWSAPVVAARLRALWRRAGAPSLGAAGAADTLRFGALTIRLREREVLQAGRRVPLTEGEFEVLWLLASQAGVALSRRDILKRVRGIDDQPLDRSIDSRVYRIRAKLGDSDGVRQPRIRTVRHRGYLFSPVGW
jgi:DNA-binding response OmpR family regulator